MQIAKLHWHYLKKAFSNWTVWLYVLGGNLYGFFIKYQLEKSGKLAATIRDARNFWATIFAAIFINFLFYLMLVRTIQPLYEPLIIEPALDGEDALFLVYSSPTKRQSMVNSKFLAEFSFFMLVNFLYSLSSCYFWIKNSSGFYDYLHIFFQLVIIPIIIFFLLAFFLTWLISLFEKKTIIVRWVVPSAFFLVAFSILSLTYLILKDRSIGFNTSLLNLVPDFLLNYPIISLLTLVFFSFLVGMLFYYLYSDNFQKKDIV